MSDKEKILEALQDELAPVLEGAADDIRQYLERISTSMAEAISTGDVSRVATLKAQLRAIGELQRVRANEHSWNLISSAIGVAVRVAISSLGAPKPANTALNEGE